MATQPDASQLKMRLEIVPEGNFFEDIALAHEIGSEISALLKETQEFVVQPVYDGKLGGAETLVFEIVVLTTQLGAIAGPVLLAAAENKAAEIVVEKIVEKMKQIFRKKKVDEDKELPVPPPIPESPKSPTIVIQGSAHSEVTISWRSDQEQATITIKVSA